MATEITYLEHVLKSRQEELANRARTDRLKEVLNCFGFSEATPSGKEITVVGVSRIVYTRGNLSLMLPY